MSAPTPSPAPHSSSAPVTASQPPAADSGTGDAAARATHTPATRRRNTPTVQPLGIAAAPAHHLNLYSRPLHPELFTLKARRRLTLPGVGTTHPAADVEAWLMPLSHALRFQLAPSAAGGICICELVTDRNTGLPTTGIAAAVPADSERELEHVFTPQGATTSCTGPALLYSFSSQTETLSAPIYATCFKEMLELAKETNALLHTWKPESLGDKAGSRQALSMLELHRYEDELHCNTTHMWPGNGLVLRCQTVVERV